MTEVASARTLVSQYSHHTAKTLLLSPNVANVGDAGLIKCLNLAEQLARQPDAAGLTTTILQNIAVIAYASHKDAEKSEAVFVAQRIFDIALQNSPKLRDEFGTEVIQAFIIAFTLGSSGGLDNSSISMLQRTSLCLLALLSAHPANIILQFSQPKLMVPMAKAYDHLSSLPQSSNPAMKRDILRVKVQLLDAMHILFSSTTRSSTSKSLDLVYALLDLPSSTPSSSNNSPFTTRGLLGDYEATWALSSDLIAPSSDKDPRYEFVQSQLKSLAGRRTFSENAQALQPLLASHISTLSTTPHAPTSIQESKAAINAAGKGKGRAPIQEEDPHQKHDYSAAISQILDIFPDENPTFLEAALAHPAYAGNAETLTNALLEGSSLPDGLDALRKGEISAPMAVVGNQPLSVPTAVPDDLISSRRNAFEDDPLDFSRLRIGKDRSQNADGFLQDKAFASEYKEEILRRAREQVEEEEEAERAARQGVLGHTKTVAFEEELSDVDDDVGAGAVSARNLKVGDGDASDEEDGGAAKTNAMIGEILELAYIKDTKLFDRDANTRRSKARADLRAETGWDDEQIEGWRIMLDRNPHKDRILAKHDFSGNQSRGTSTPARSTPAASGPPSENESASRGRGSGRGGSGGDHNRGRTGRGGGGGRGRGGGGENTDRDRARKDRQGNQARKRGHDKKMARGGFAPPS